ncbi:MAG: hypothetical protein CMF49_05460 [Legionellales bacterium]|nr:hypothetical protein [Legionellales bacterium]
MSKFSWGWGHSFKNYLLMFDLQDNELQEPILDVAAGASSFNAEMHGRGYYVVSADPLYALSMPDLKLKIDRMGQTLRQWIEQHKAQFLLRDKAAFEDLIAKQKAMANIFIQDFQEGVYAKRYVADPLPNLSFSHAQYALALCANFLFDGPYAKDMDFQLKAILEMCRVAREVRIFPLLDDSGEVSQHVAPLMAVLQSKNYGVEIREVPFHLQKNGNAMLRVWSNECQL